MRKSNDERKWEIVVRGTEEYHFEYKGNKR